MSHVTLIVPYVPFNEEAINITRRCVESFVEQVDRIILIENGQMFNNNLSEICNHFITNRSNILLAGAINQGYLAATYHEDCEFLCFSNNDVECQGTNLHSLCEKGAIVSPKVSDQRAGWGAHGSFFVVHKDDFKKVGFWNLGYGNAADEEWFKRARDRGVGLKQNPEQRVHHGRPAFTINQVDIIWEIND